MRPIAIGGIVLIMLGAAALAYQGFTYTSRETVIDIGPLKATADRQKTVLLPPLVGVAVIAGGVVLLIAGVRKRARGGDSAHHHAALATRRSSAASSSGASGNVRRNMSSSAARTPAALAEDAPLRLAVRVMHRQFVVAQRVAAIPIRPRRDQPRHEVRLRMIREYQLVTS
jgi:hypothetical protein